MRPRQTEQRLTPFGLNAIVASVYKGPAGTIRRECIVIDYSKTSLLPGDP
jgi:hypothetical protein